MSGLAFSFTQAPAMPWRAASIVPAREAARPLPTSLRNTTELCELVVNYAPRFLPARAIVERKHDGMRALWIDGKLVTRGGATLWCTAHLWADLAALDAEFGEPMFLDMEYREAGGFGATARRTSRAIWERGPVDGTGDVWLWDAVPTRVWREGGASAALVARKRDLHAALTRLQSPGRAAGLHYVDHVAVAGEAHLRAIEAAEYARGGEGVVVKDATAQHHPGRSRYWQRLKRKLSLDLVVIGYSESKSDPGTLGAIIVDHDGVGVRVHAGFTDRERIVLWHYPDCVVGRIAEIEAMEATELGSLRQPRFLNWRDDLTRRTT